MLFKVLIAVVAMTTLVHAQNSSDCGTTYTCFKHPDGCADSVCTFIYKWKENGADKMDFVIAAQVVNLTTRWVGIGLSLDNTMTNDSIVACKTTNEVVHLFSIAHSSPPLMNASNPTVGITNTSVTQSGGWLICAFTRQDQVSTQTNYYSIRGEYHLLAAFGPLRASGDIGYHTSANRIPSTTKIQFKAALVTTSTTTQATTTTTRSSQEKISSCLSSIISLIFISKLVI